MSFPNCRGPERATHAPDLVLLDQLAREARVELRVVYLSRPFGQLIRSELETWLM